MSRGGKIVLVGCVGFVGLALIAWALGIATLAGARAVLARRSAPERVAEVGHEIADYAVPEGYVSEYSAKFAGFAIAAYRPEGRRGHLMIAQIPEWVGTDRKEIERQMHRAIADQDGESQLRVEEVREVVVRGEPTTVTVSLGRSSDGFEFKQLFAVFEGRNGTACIMAIDGVDHYDQGTLDAFIASIG